MPNVIGNIEDGPINAGQFGGAMLPESPSHTSESKDVIMDQFRDITGELKRPIQMRSRSKNRAANKK